MSLIKMRLPIFGSEGEEFCPCFYLERVRDESDEEFVQSVEQSASKILGEISEWEYLSRRAIDGLMPRLNRVFEEMKVAYGERVIPDKILKAAAEKGSKAPRVAAATSAAVTQAESKKRKDGEGSKAVPKRRKVAMAAADSAEEVAKSGQGALENAPGGPARCMDEDLMISTVTPPPTEPPSAAAPSSSAAAAPPVAPSAGVTFLPGIFGDDSSESEEEIPTHDITPDVASASKSEESPARGERSAKTRVDEESKVESDKRVEPPAPEADQPPPEPSRPTQAATSSEVAREKFRQRKSCPGWVPAPSWRLRRRWSFKGGSRSWRRGGRRRR